MLVLKHDLNMSQAAQRLSRQYQMLPR